MPALKSASAMIAAAQTSAAASIAGRERHGDGGAEMLATAAGLPIGEARSQVKTARALRDLPVVRDAVESGRVTRANAKQLAAAVEKAGPQAVEADGELLAKAESMRPEQFRRVARRWTAEREGDHGASEHARQRARRRVRVWDGDDGMVHLHGEFDAVTGKQVASRLRAEASRMHDADKKGAKANGAGRRSFDQCMADALDYLTAGNDSRGAGQPFADICVVAHVDDDTAKLVAELPDGTRLPAEVLDTLTSNAKLTGLIYDRCGKPIWRTEARPTATRAQRQVLNARWGGCFHCGVHFAICQPHHIEPGIAGRADQARQPRPGLLGLPQPHPPRRLADPQAPRRQPHPAPTRPSDLRTRVRRRRSPTVQAEVQAGARSEASQGGARHNPGWPDRSPSHSPPGQVAAGGPPTRVISPLAADRSRVDSSCNRDGRATAWSRCRRARLSSRLPGRPTRRAALTQSGLADPDEPGGLVVE